MRRIAVLFGGSFIGGFVVGRVAARRSRKALAWRGKGVGVNNREQHDDEVLIYDQGLIAPTPATEGRG